MTVTDNTAAAGSSLFSTAVNVLTSPREAFQQIDARASKLFPLALVIIPTMLVMVWYFLGVDYDWYVDDVLTTANVQGEDLEQARATMLSMSRNTFMALGVLSSAVVMLAIYLLQAMYLSLASALTGDKYKFGHWFSLACWAGIPYLVSVLGMIVTIALNSNGQLGAYELDPLTLSNLGMQTGNASLQTLFSAVNLPMVWTLALLTSAYRQWLAAGLFRSIAVVTAPYALIFGIWAYIALI